LRQFVSAFRNYSLLGGTRSAASFLHSDVILYFQTMLGVDLSELSSDGGLLQFRSFYAPNDYSMHFFAFLSDNPDAWKRTY
jgi:hypothetical protein